MASWDIDPRGVQGQLKAVGTKAGDLEKALNALIEDMSEASTAAGTAVPGSVTRMQGPVPVGHAPLSAPMGPVGAALAEYMNVRQRDLQKVADRIQAAVLGAAQATNAYVEGDLEAAANAQDAARSVRLDALLEATEGHR